MYIIKCRPFTIYYSLVCLVRGLHRHRNNGSDGWPRAATINLWTTNDLFIGGQTKEEILRQKVCITRFVTNAYLWNSPIFIACCLLPDGERITIECKLTLWQETDWQLLPLFAIAFIRFWYWRREQKKKKKIARRIMLVPSIYEFTIFPSFSIVFIQSFGWVCCVFCIAARTITISRKNLFDWFVEWQHKN